MTSWSIHLGHQQPQTTTPCVHKWTCPTRFKTIYTNQTNVWELLRVTTIGEEDEAATAPVVS